MCEPRCAQRPPTDNGLSASQRNSVGRGESHPATIRAGGLERGGGEEGDEGEGMERARGEKRQEERESKRPGESGVTVFITAPDPLHRSGPSRAGPFNWEVNLRGDENDKKKKVISVSCHCRGT